MATHLQLRQSRKPRRFLAFRQRLYFCYLLRTTRIKLCIHWYQKKRVRCSTKATTGISTNAAAGQSSLSSSILREQIVKQKSDARLILRDICYTRGTEAAETNDESTALQNNTAFLRLRLNISKTSAVGTRTLAQAYYQAANANIDQSLFDNP
jgi:hypothetical protein